MLDNTEGEEKKSPLKKYKIISQLGEGSYAKVFLVKHKQSQKLFALKILDKQRLKSPLEKQHVKIERQILIDLPHHANIVSLKETFQTNNHLFFVLEYCQGGELFTLLSRKHRLKENQARFYAAQILLALEHLHNHKVLYRDLKPENVLICYDGYIKLTDFGLSLKNYDK